MTLMLSLFLSLLILDRRFFIFEEMVSLLYEKLGLESYAFLGVEMCTLLLMIADELTNNYWAVVSLYELFLPISDVSVVDYYFRIRRILRVTRLVTPAVMAIAELDSP